MLDLAEAFASRILSSLVAVNFQGHVLGLRGVGADHDVESAELHDAVHVLIVDRKRLGRDFEFDGGFLARA